MAAIGLDLVLRINGKATFINQLHESHGPTHRWVMSTTTRISHVSKLLTRLADLAV
jgi:hypothetical protein